MFRSPFIIFIALISIAAGGCGPKAGPASPLPASLAHPSDAASTGASADIGKVADQGTLRIYRKGKEVGAESFMISEREAGGHRISSKTVMQVGERLVAIEGTLDTDAAWKPEVGAFRRQ